MNFHEGKFTDFSIIMIIIKFKLFDWRNQVKVISIIKFYLFLTFKNVN